MKKFKELNKDKYISKTDYQNYKETYLKNKIISKLFLNIYIEYHNYKYIKKELLLSDNLLSNINGYSLDKQQRSAVICDENNILIVAGAGSGKTLTMVGKVRYLIENKAIKEEEILCISFTNESTKSLHKAINKYKEYKVQVKTFHKLALDIISQSNTYCSIAPPDTLELVIEEYFNIEIYDDDKYQHYVIQYLKYFYKDPSIEYKYLINLKKVVIAFINTFKANGMEEEEFKKLFSRRNKKKNTLLLLIIYKIYTIYHKELRDNKQIDFNDMINISTKVIKDEKVKLNYKYILIDEYQDTSNTRYLLIKAIMGSTSAKLIVVGDDFQSIYAFTGCNLNIFLNFKKYFGYTKILKIENTYRCSKELITAAGKFVMENNKQLRKRLQSHKRLERPIVICIYKDLIKKVEKIINEIFINSKETIMIIGRNNKDINAIIDNKTFSLKENKVIYNQNKAIDIYYLTVHKSKGLEENNVIIINLIDDVTGFPNKIQDIDIIKMINNRSDIEIYEERRLFYVAITRTKNKVYLMTPYKNKSIFVNEIIKKHKSVVSFFK